MSYKYGYPLCIQLTPPEHDYGDKEFAKILQLLSDRGFFGVELNITDFNTDPIKLKEYLDSYGLKLTMIASGAYAKREKLSMSSLNKETQKKTLDALKIMGQFAENFHAGVICGFIKGSVKENSPEEKETFSDFIKILYNNTVSSGIYLEATNHYESASLNCVSEGAELIGDPGKGIWVLPDTYHMNIEESSMTYALTRFKDYYRNVHISDNNRYFPGFGSIDFYQVFKTLQGLNYKGTVTIEGRVRESLYRDICFTCDYLENIGKRL